MKHLIYALLLGTMLLPVTSCKKEDKYEGDTAGSYTVEGYVYGQESRKPLASYRVSLSSTVNSQGYVTQAETDARAVTNEEGYFIITYQPSGSGTKAALYRTPYNYQCNFGNKEFLNGLAKGQNLKTGKIYVLY